MTRLHPRRGAFTLIELVGALAILSLLAGAVAVVIGGALDNQRSRLAAERFVGWDAHVRRAARNHQRPLTIGRGQRTDDGETLAVIAERTRDSEAVVATASPPVHRVRLITEAEGWTDDPIAWRMSADAISPSIAVTLRPTESESIARRKTTPIGPAVVVAGLTGQAVVVEQTEWIDALANAMQAPRALTD
ncbi:MAG: type II secretion system protein [Planctomycetota bacterium]